MGVAGQLQGPKIRRIQQPRQLRMRASQGAALTHRQSGQVAGHSRASAGHSRLPRTKQSGVQGKGDLGASMQSQSQDSHTNEGCNDEYKLPR